MSQRVARSGLQVAQELDRLVTEEILPAIGVSSDRFYAGLAQLVAHFGARNRALLEKRESLQQQIDQWHREHRAPWDAKAYAQFLLEIGYLVPEPEQVTVTTEHVDAEIAELAGPQLVVPVMNARYALNAANARWGSLYDALYGTDVIPESHGCERSGAYNPARGARVIDYVAGVLDQIVPLSVGSHRQVGAYWIEQDQLCARLQDGRQVVLAHPEQWCGWCGEAMSPERILLVNHGLHIELFFDRHGVIGSDSPCGLQDVLLEAALTTIQDAEDSVAAVDAEDKTLVYRNWLGLMRGDLTETVIKGERRIERRLQEDRHYRARAGQTLTLPGRSLMLVRNVGHLMTTPAVLDGDGQEIPEGILDALVTSAIAMHDLQGHSPVRNSRTGSVYIVKPKMHGPEEVAFANELFDAVEDILGLARHTLKIGVMDEERRTTVNLKSCIAQVAQRIIFINTGFLDRTGDEIHTSMEAGAVVPKTRMKEQAWINAYEDWNVDIGLECGLPGHAQIGKGMWPKPDEMAEMLRTKVAHPQAGANCAWVPSPTGAVLHALHYHQVDVRQQQRRLRQRPRASLMHILQVPLMTAPERASLSAEQIQRELDNNAQGILGYVVRWVEQGVGCSKVPDIQDVGLMEDRATLRISSQHITNWLRHGVCSKEQVLETLARMAAVVDRQNAGDPAYTPMVGNPGGSLALEAATQLILEGCAQPSGYTEPLLHHYRRLQKARTR